MINPEIKKLHGLPSIGVNGVQGVKGKNGRSIYFGHINNFFTNITYNLGKPFIYDTKFNQSAASYINRHNNSDTDYYTSFVDSTNIKNLDRNRLDLTKNNIHLSIYNVSTYEGASYATIYEYNQVQFNDISIYIPQTNILVDLKYSNFLNAPTNSDFINNIEFNKNSTGLWEVSTHTLQPYSTTWLNNLDSITTEVSIGFSERDRSFGDYNTPISDASFKQIIIDKLAGRSGYVYYHTPYDPTDIQEIKNAIISNIQKYNGKIPLMSNIEYNNVQIDGDNLFVNIPLTLKDTYKEGDILYIWENEDYINSAGGHNIDYMIIITKELEGAPYNDIIANLTKVKPFSLLSIDSDENKTTLFNNLNIINYTSEQSAIFNNERISKYKQNFINSIQSNTLLSIDQFNHTNNLSLNIAEKNGSDSSTLSVSAYARTGNTYYITSAKNLIFDSDVYINNSKLGNFYPSPAEETVRIINNTYFIPELLNYIKPSEINTDSEENIVFNISDNNFSNTKPYILTFSKSNIITSNQYINYTFDILTWYTTIENDEIISQSKVYHHINSDEENIVNLDLTDEIENEIENNKIYIEENDIFEMHILLKCYKLNITSFYSPCYYIKFNNWNPYLNKFESLNIQSISSSDTKIDKNELKDIVSFNLSNILDFNKDCSTTLTITINNPDYQFVVDSSLYCSKNISEEQTSDFKINSLNVISSSENIYEFTTTSDLIPEYSGNDVPNFVLDDLFKLGSEEGPGNKLYTLQNNLAKTSNKNGWVGIDVQNVSTGEIKTCYYDIYQQGMQDTRVRPSVTFTPLLKNNKLEMSNNIDNGVLANQFQYFIDVTVDNFNYDTWGKYLYDNDSATLSLTFAINSKANNNQCIKDLHFSNLISSFSTIHFIGQTTDYKLNNFKFKFNGYKNIDPLNMTISELNAINDENIITDSSLQYQPIDNANQVLYNTVITNRTYSSIFNSLEEPNMDWYYIPEDMYTSNSIGDSVDVDFDKQKLQYTGIYAFDTVTFNNLTFEDCINGKLTLRLFIEEDNPILTYLNYDVALVESTVTLNYNGQTYTYKFPEESYMQEISFNEYTQTTGVKYTEYINSSGLQTFILNPVSLIGAKNIDGSVSGSVKLTGPSDYIETKTELFNPVLSITSENNKKDLYTQLMSSTIFEDDNTSENVYLINSYIILNALYPQKHGLQDNVKALSVMPINPHDLQETSNSNFFNTINTYSTNNLIYKNFISNLENEHQIYESDSYLAFQYNLNLLRPHNRSGEYIITYNTEDYDAEKYNQYPDSVIFSTESVEIEQRTSEELESIETWNYEYEQTSYYDPTKTIGGVITKSGNGYYYLKYTDQLREDYVDDNTIDFEDLQQSQKTKINFDNTQIINNYSDYFRQLLWNAYWQYPKYINNNKIIPYNFITPFVSDIEYKINKSENLNDLSLQQFTNKLNEYFGNQWDTEEYLDKKIYNRSQISPSEKLSNIDWCQFIPYNLCYQIYPRVIINNQNTFNSIYNILMLRKPTIGNDKDEFITGFNIERETMNSPIIYNKPIE